MRLNIRERELVLRSIYIMREGKKFLHGCVVEWGVTKY